jgi:pleckstrin homology domain-containing family A member 1/2
VVRRLIDDTSQTWKKRWFVLRPAHLAYYKTSAEYQLLKILDLGEVHSCTPISLKKHANTFGLVSPVRTFYLQANTQEEVQSWIKAIQDARETLMATSTVQSVPTPPIPIPGAGGRSEPQSQPPVVSSPPASYGQNVTSSDSEDGSPSANRSYSTSSQTRPAISSSPSKVLPTASKGPSGVVVSGYLMKCGSKRHNWRKRWFVLDSEKLIYSGSHMVSFLLPYLLCGS